MKRRVRTKMGASLCFHTSPNGKSVMGKKQILVKKFNSGEITSEELHSLALMGFSVRELKKEPDFGYVTVFGVKKKVTMAEFKEHYEHLGFTLTNN